MHTKVESHEIEFHAKFADFSIGIKLVDALEIVEATWGPLHFFKHIVHDVFVRRGLETKRWSTDQMGRLIS